MFGFYVIYIVRMFFLVESEFVLLMLIFVVFGFGFLMCFVGVIVFGVYIDRIGCCKGLMVILVIMGCGMLFIVFVFGY